MMETSPLKELEELLEDKDNIVLGSVGDLFIDIEQELRIGDFYDRNTTPKYYLNQQIEELRTRLENPRAYSLDEKAVDYVKKVIGAMERTRDAGISLNRISVLW